ncbi:hypothetical protein L202_08120 [Cryptococcus amylolentus CBS 6039]|uniref:Alpha-1,2-mannosidase n=1 Tax=Cryptococcus amylolentus CBS 6039 TaxID=1295533 RepID=A0A1E3HB52_9TREE|nr:hypothetical protein L202_08120 [Cryptococcus amylolentus CBS 6039]ODN72681.1 hypothetical protein L202_08120 [Cryptococcus amylolentus CBS 6039]
MPPRPPPLPRLPIQLRRTLLLLYHLTLTIFFLLLALTIIYVPISGVYNHLQSLQAYISSPKRDDPFLRLVEGKRLDGRSLLERAPEGEVYGHADFQDGRRQTVRPEFLEPNSEALGWVNVNLGNGGPEPNLSGGMIPAISTPFGMTRWTPQTRANYVSMCPYNQTDTKLHGFIATHQPAIWMGESAPLEVSPSLANTPKVLFDDRALPFDRSDEYASPNYYRNLLKDEGGHVEAELTASSRVGHMRFTFQTLSPSSSASSSAKVVPRILIQPARSTFLVHGDKPDDRVPYHPNGFIRVDWDKGEVWGWGDERQDHILVGDDLPAKNFKGYFVAQFSRPFSRFATSKNGTITYDDEQAEGAVLAGFVEFEGGDEEDEMVVEMKVGISWVSVEQARRNIELESTPFPASPKDSSTWAEHLNRLSVSGATGSNKTVLYTSLAHTLVYPYEVSENTTFLTRANSSSPTWSDDTEKEDGENTVAYYSGYLDALAKGESYSGYSLWDTARAQHPLLILLAPSRVPGMITSMLQDWKEGGWMPMWKNVVETNIMVGTFADAVMAGAVLSGVKGFDLDEAWEAVKKNAFTPPERDTELQFGDREENTPQEVRAGLTEYTKLGYVADDLHTESGSRTLDYAYLDHAAALLASHPSLSHLNLSSTASLLNTRSKNYKSLWNNGTSFMEARNSDGSWAGDENGWTEGDKWAYSLDVMHDVPGLAELMGGNASFVDFMDRHFAGGHNLHTNEPSHHIPYLYSLASAPDKSQFWLHSLASSEYNHTAAGLSGNEDCGQMSAWYIFTALGFYPVDPASATYVLGSPLFDKIVLRLPTAPWDEEGGERVLEVVADGASKGRVYVKGLTVEGESWEGIEVGHDVVTKGGKWVWEMDDRPQKWGRQP